MTGSERRFAIYFAPEDGTALAKLGWPWLGRYPDTPEDAPFLMAVAADDGHAAIVSDPRLYGLHATLKPPFRLAVGTSRDRLLKSINKFCARVRKIDAPPLSLGEIDGFLALRPSAAMQAIDSLAADCVREFDGFRAAAGAAETAKRVAHGLTTRQRELLERWGYPYVFDEFRFHITLTGRLPEAERAAARTTLQGLLHETELEPLKIYSLCLFEQPGPGERFLLTERVPFRG